MKKQDLVTLAMICISAGLLIGGCVQKTNTQQYGKKAEQMSSDMQSFYNSLSSDSQRKFMALDMRHKRAAFQMATQQGMDANMAVEQQYQDQTNRGATNGTGYQYQQGAMGGSNGYANGGSALSADMQDFYYALSTESQKKFMALDMRHKRAAMAIVAQGGIDANSAVEQQYQDQMKQRGMMNGSSGTSGYGYRSPYASDRAREEQYGYGQPSMYTEMNSATTLSTDMQNFYNSLSMDAKTKFMALDQRHKKAAMQQSIRRNMDPNQSVERQYAESMRQQGYYYQSEDSTSTNGYQTQPRSYQTQPRSGYGEPTTGYSSNYNFESHEQQPQPQQQCPGYGY